VKTTNIKIGPVQFTSDTPAPSVPVIGVFADEHAGKTRFALTGPDNIGFIVTEMKTYATLEKDAPELGKTVFKPSDPMSLIASTRKVGMMKSDVDKQKYFMNKVKTIEDSTFGLLEHPDVNLVVIDKFTHYCAWKEFAINGMSENIVLIGGKPVQRKAEVIQGIIDFLNGLSQFGKPVLLLCSAKPDFDVLDKTGHPVRNTFNCASFYFLGSHTNTTVELMRNPIWDPESNKEKEAWHYRLGVRTCQMRPELEGPEGNPLLEDAMVTLPGLMGQVDPNCDIDFWMGE